MSYVSWIPRSCIAVGSSIGMEGTIGFSRGQKAASSGHHHSLPTGTWRIHTLDNNLDPRVLS
jgi:hypothetical protein